MHIEIQCFSCHGTESVNGLRCPECTSPSDEELQVWAEKNKINGWKWFTEEKPPTDTLLIVAIGGCYWITKWRVEQGYDTYYGYVTPAAYFENCDCDDAFLQCECKEVLWRLADFQEVTYSHQNIGV